MKKRLTALAVALVTVLSLCSLASCRETEPEASAEDNSESGIVSVPTYTYNDYLKESPVTWNPFNWMTDEDEYVIKLTQMGLYDFVLNDQRDGYELLCEMAAADPVDVTSKYASLSKWGIPEGATQGYAYSIALNPDACWQDGTPINADTYVYSMQKLLSGTSYRDTVFTNGRLALVKGEEYSENSKVGQPIYKDNVVGTEYLYSFDDWQKGADGTYSVLGKKLVFALDAPLAGMNGYSIQSWHEESGGTDFAVCITQLRQLADENGFVDVTDETIEILYSFTGSASWGKESKKALASYVYYQDGVYTSTPWESVGFLKTGEYEITLILKAETEPFQVKYNLTSNFLVHPQLYEDAPGLYGTNAENYCSFGPYKLVTYLESRVLVFERNENWYGYTDGKHTDQFNATTVNCTVITDHNQAKNDFISGKVDKLLLTPADMEEYGDSEYVRHAPEDFTMKLSFNGSIDSLKKRESEGVNKSILAYKDFRKAISLAVDRTAFCSDCTVNGVAGYGLLNYLYVCDEQTGALYRENQYAMDALCQLYGVNNVAEINGYNPDSARELFLSAYERCLEDGNISETDVIVLELSVLTVDEFFTKIAKFLNESINTAVEGTALEGRISIKLKKDENFYSNCKKGLTDIIISTWGGSAMDPFSILECYCLNEKHYEYGFDATSEFLTITVGEEEITASYTEWYKALSHGEYASAEQSVRLMIMAELEKGILSQYFAVPLCYTTSGSLVSKKVLYGAEEYVLNLDFGGIRYMTFVYSDEEWARYIAESNGSFNY